MAEIVNLRQARKRAAKADRESRAEKNRALHSLPARERKAAAKHNERENSRHEAHKIERPDGGDTAEE